MKKNLIFVLAMCLLFSLTACGISENEPKPTAEPLEKTVSPATEPPAEKPAEIPAAEQKPMLQKRCSRTNTAHRQQNVRMQDVQDQSPQAGIPTAVPFILAHAQNAGATSTRMRRGA